MTRGEFADIRRRMRGMDGDIRGLANTSGLASDRADRLGQSIRGVSGRLGQMQRVGSLANHEMDYMRRSMGLLGRDLRLAARAGEITEEEFKNLRDELDETRLAFDRLDNETRRHSAVANRRVREAAAAQREERRQQMQHGQQIVDQMRRLSRAHDEAIRENARRDAEAARAQNAQQREERRRQMALGQQIVDEMRRISRAHDEALRENARRDAAARREERQRQMSHGAQIVAHQRRINRAHAAALREDEARTRRAEAERRRVAAQAAARMRQQEAEFRRHLSRLASMSTSDDGLSDRFRGLGDGDHRRMSRSLRTLADSLNTVSTSNFRARGSANALTRDLGVMGRVLRNAARDGRLSQREFNALSNALRQTTVGAASLRRSGAITRSTFRDMRREASLLRAQLNLLGDEGDIFTRLDSRMVIFQNRLRDSSRHSGVLRRAMGGLGEGMVSGMRGGTAAVAMLTGGLRRMGSMLNVNRRWTAILIAALVLIGPAAQALGALLVTALGGAFIALGAFALRGSAQVGQAFDGMKNTLNNVLREAAQPLEKSLVAGIRQVAVAARQMQPALTKVFAATAPLVEDFVGGLTDVFARALPGFGKALSQSLPVMEGFREAMGLIGDGLGGMFEAMTADGGADALADVWRTMGMELKNLLINIGEFINAAAKSGAATMLMVAAFRTLSGILHVVEFSLAAVSALAAGTLSVWGDELRTTGKWMDVAKEKAQSLLDAGNDSDTLNQRLAEVNTQIEKIIETRKRANEEGIKPDQWAELGIDDKTLNAALEEREVLTDAVALAESNAATETEKHATSVRNLIKQIQDLAGLNRNHLDAVSAQEEAIDNAVKNQGKWGNALKFTNGQLDLTTKAGRDAHEQLSNIARTTKEATDKAIEANVPWAEVNKRWQTGRENLIKLADGWGLNKEQAKELADQILGMPPKKEVFVEAQTSDAVASLDNVIAAMQETPTAKTITVKTLSQEAQKILEDIGYTVTRLPDGSFTITAATGAASSAVGKVQEARDKLTGKKIDIAAAVGGAITDIGRAQSARDNFKSKKVSIGATVGGALADIGRAQAARDNLKAKSINISASTGAFHASVSRIVGSSLGTAYINVVQRYDNQVARPFGAKGGSASSLPMKRFATGGSISGGVLDGPGTKTSDGIIARLSRGEFVMRAAAVDKYGVAAMQRINMGLLPRFHRGGSPTKSEREAISDVKGHFTVSRFGKMAGWKQDEFVNAFAKAESLMDVVSELNQTRSTIMKTTHGSTERRLLGTLDVGGRVLIKYQKQLMSTNKALEKAKDKLADLKQAASQLKDSIKQGIISELNVTRSASKEDSQVTLNTIMSQMTADSANAKAFQSMLNTLRKRGVSGHIIEQVGQAGIEGGGLETARALLSASSSQIKRMNSMNASIRKSADDTGDVVSDAMYKAGIAAAEGLVKGLQKKQDFIERQMLQLAQFIEKAIKRALKIKSPSKVMERLGSFTAEGFALGIERNNRPKHSWKSLLDIPSDGGRHYTPTRSSSGDPMVIQLHIGGKNIGEIIIDPLRKSIRHRGGDVQAVLGK